MIRVFVRYTRHRPLSLTRHPGAHRASLAVFGLVSLVLSFQVSGFGHFFGDVVSELVDGVHPSDEDCESTPHECPPGCPSCHQGHISAMPKLPEVSVVTLRVAVQGAVSTPPEAKRPASPDLPSIYRPPRALI